MQNDSVLHSSPAWLPQTQTWMYGQVSELQRFGVDAHVVCEHTENLDQFKLANIHRLGVELDRIPFLPRFWVAGEPLRILISATFREKKGIPIALEALGKIQHKVPIEITLVGEATPEPRSQDERRKIFQTISRYQLRDHIRFLGFQSHRVLFDEAYSHHIFLSPSVTAKDGDTEGAPVSIIEMAASGMPIVSTMHCDIPDVMQPVASRFLAPERNSDDLVDIIRKILHNWSALETPLATLRHHIEREYNDKVQGKRLAGLYRELLKH